MLTKSRFVKIGELTKDMFCFFLSIMGNEQIDSEWRWLISMRLNINAGRKTFFLYAARAWQ